MNPRCIAQVVVVAAAGLGLSAAVPAQPVTRGDLTIDQVYTREPPPGASTAAAYLTIDNRGREPDRLTSASSPRAAAVEIHSMRSELGVMRMRQVGELIVPARGKVKLVPGGVHLMIVEPTSPLRAGERVPVTLTFMRAGPIDVQVTVEPMTGSGHTH
jgi:copper(I)-binding protein